jgi:hypothetical protein
MSVTVLESIQRHSNGTTVRIPGRIIAQFASGLDAQMFARAATARHGKVFTVTAGIDMPFAVRPMEIPS